MFIKKIILRNIKYYNLNLRYFWGLGIGDWGLGPIPNPQSPIPFNKEYNMKYKIYIILYKQ